MTEDAHIPIAFRCTDGNASDSRTHIENWNMLRALAGRADFLYVADSKKCSHENMDYIDRASGCLGYAQELWTFGPRSYWLSTPTSNQLRQEIRAFPNWGAERSPRSSAPTRCSHTGFSIPWSHAIRSSTQRYCRCRMFRRKWRFGARKTYLRRSWWRCTPTTRSQGFKPSRTSRPTFRR
jgi:hypothetical protein